MLYYFQYQILMVIFNNNNWFKVAETTALEP